MKVCLEPSSASTAIWWCHTHSQDPSRPIGTYWNPFQARLLDQNIPSLWKAWITGSLIFSEVSNFSSEAAAELPAAADSILPLQALGVDAEEVPHGTHVALLGGLMDVLASGHEPNPLGAAGRGTAR